MLDGGWRADVTAGGLFLVIIALLAAALSDEREKLTGCYESADHHCRNTARDWPESVVPQIPHILPEPAKPNPKRGEWRSERDLEAQWEAAIWTRYSVIVGALFSLAGLFVNAFGIYYVRRTLKANLAAVGAAHKAIESERETSEAQVRAYLSISDVTFDGTVAIGSPNVVFKISNSGNSPAKEVWVECFALDASDLHSLKISNMGRGIFIGVVRQGAPSIEKSIRCSGINRRPSLDGVFNIDFRLTVFFRDVFGKVIDEDFDFVGECETSRWPCKVECAHRPDWGDKIRGEVRIKRARNRMSENHA